MEKPMDNMWLFLKGILAHRVILFSWDVQLSHETQSI